YLGEKRIEEWHSQKVRYLLACLAAHPGRPVSEDMLVETFWPEDPIKGKNNLYTTTSNLRRSLRPPGWKGEVNYIPRTPAGLSLNSDMPRWHDLEELERALRDASAAGANQEQALDACARAARLYRGPYLDGCYYDWAMMIRNRLEVKMLDALQRLVSGLVARQRWSEVLEYSQRLLELEPCSQEACLAIMKSHLAQGHPEQAIRQFEGFSALLKKELALEPSSTLLEMRQRALLSIA
ncbi:MAG: BTAD domain-containing putative transcriptional regulator, partial [Candidatus Eremiobacterota bacterium]